LFFSIYYNDMYVYQKNHWNNLKNPSAFSFKASASFFIEFKSMSFN
jgi:hypothetical protein